VELPAVDDVIGVVFHPLHRGMLAGGGIPGAGVHESFLGRVRHLDSDGRCGDRNLDVGKSAAGCDAGRGER